jgi:hypothetical protein
MIRFGAWHALLEHVWNKMMGCAYDKYSCILERNGLTRKLTL